MRSIGFRSTFKVAHEPLGMMPDSSGTRCSLYYIDYLFVYDFSRPDRLSWSAYGGSETRASSIVIMSGSIAGQKKDMQKEHCTTVSFASAYTIKTQYQLHPSSSRVCKMLSLISIPLIGHHTSKMRLDISISLDPTTTILELENVFEL